MIHHGSIAIPRTLSDLAHPERTALLVYDMQVGICSQLKDGPRLIALAAEMIAAARSAGIRIVYTRHLSLPTRWMGATQMRTALAWQSTDDPEAVRPWFLRDSEAIAIVPELAPTSDDAVFDKVAMSAFEGTPLGFALRDCGLTGLAILGIAMEIGIEPTARQATDLGFVPILITDAIGHGNAEAAEQSLSVLRHAGEAILTDAAAFEAALGEH